MQKVKIKIASKIAQLEQVENVVIEEIGQWDDANKILEYTQSNNNSKSVIKVVDQKIIINQENGAELVFVEDKKTPSKISTPQGDIYLSIDARVARFNQINEKSGQFKLQYILFQNEVEMGNFELELHFEPVV